MFQTCILIEEATEKLFQVTADEANACFGAIEAPRLNVGDVFDYDINQNRYALVVVKSRLELIRDDGEEELKWFQTLTCMVESKTDTHWS